MRKRNNYRLLQSCSICRRFHVELDGFTQWISMNRRNRGACSSHSNHSVYKHKVPERFNHRTGTKSSVFLPNGFQSFSQQVFLFFSWFPPKKFFSDLRFAVRTTEIYALVPLRLLNQYRIDVKHSSNLFLFLWFRLLCLKAAQINLLWDWWNQAGTIEIRLEVSTAAESEA